MIRHKVCMITRNYLSNNDFIEVETPILSTLLTMEKKTLKILHK